MVIVGERWAARLCQTHLNLTCRENIIGPEGTAHPMPFTNRNPLYQGNLKPYDKNAQSHASLKMKPCDFVSMDIST